MGAVNLEPNGIINQGYRCANFLKYFKSQGYRRYQTVKTVSTNMFSEKKKKLIECIYM